MNLKQLLIAAAVGGTTFGWGESGTEPPTIRIWAVDPLVKVFRDALPVETEEAVAEVARGEHATFQIVVRGESPIQKLCAEVSTFVLEGNEAATLQSPLVRFVGYVPVDRPIQTPPKDQLRKPPAEFPDPLLEEKTIDVEPDQAQPIWITLPISQKAVPGTYRGSVCVSGVVKGRDVYANLPLAVRVFAARMGRARLWVTNWFAFHWLHMKINPKPDSPEYWELLRRYARNMGDHRQNVALISPLSLADFDVDEDGQLRIDFSRFDRWVTIFLEEGVIGRIEGGHLGGRSKGWDSSFVVGVRRVKNGKIQSVSVDPASDEADSFCAKFLPALVKHLRDRGWLDCYMQHLADEPTSFNAASYRAMANLVCKYAPELRIIEACHTKDLVGAIDIWVPQLDYLHRDYEHYRDRKAAGEEVWLYTCVFPQGEYANRFLEQPLLKTRLLHWINFRYGITGYLHWGYNHWTQESPFEKTTRPHGGPPYLPAGDAWIVYPGREGPLDSIRHEAMRDGISDHELLSMLSERDPVAAERLVLKHVLDFDRYNTDIETFRSTRRELLMLLSKQ
jgi:hypothetical protein